MKSALLLAILLAAPLAAGGDPYLEKQIEAVHRHREAGQLDAARVAVEGALERDDRHLEALALLAEISAEQGDRDTATWARHRWLEQVDAAAKLPVPKRARRDALKALLELDERAEDYRELVENHLRALLKLAAEYEKRERWHSALAVFQEILAVAPLDEEARAAIQRVRNSAGDELATEDLFAGADPTFGVSPDWIAGEDRKRSTWSNAWVLDGRNYRFRTDAGYLVLQTASIAMEQMNGFYRQFFRYKLDGDPTPKIAVHIFKDRDEYLKRGQGPPAEWSGGHFTGGAVETFLGGPSGRETIRQMYGTLFHEAAHQFVSLTGKGGVPGWLNEAYASFFEGVTILSNGSVRWNQVPTHRLFPLAARMERGWMVRHDEGVRGDDGDWATPERAPTFQLIVENDYEWGPPWYAPTWGVVYFLYNFRDTEGTPVWRDALHQYYLSNAAGRSNPVKHFEEVVLGAPRSPVTSILQLDALWRDWILNLRDIELGRREAGAGNLEFGRKALARGDAVAAREFFEEARRLRPDDPEALWELARLLEGLEEADRAAALYRDFARGLELGGRADDPRRAEAEEKADALDPLAARYARLRAGLAEAGLELARSYRERELPLMAMEISLRLGARLSVPAATAFYEELARATGKSLARWKLAYNEYDLEGWVRSAGYRAYGKLIAADVESDPTVAAEAGAFFARELPADVTFDADYSLEAEMRFEPGNSTIMGLCFGWKDSQNTHAVVLHPKGFLDISTKNGGSWTVRDHRSVPLDDGWVRLRIDVVGSLIDVWLDGKYIRALSMPSERSVRGGFGLITGVGQAWYRNLRILPRDGRDPAARIERELQLEEVEADGSLRQTGVFAGRVPPPLKVAKWLDTTPVTLEQLRGRPALLVFWSPRQERVIHTAGYYQHLLEKWSPLGVRMVVLVNSAGSEEEARGHLGGLISDCWVGLDAEFASYNAYNVKPGGWGLPRILLLDVDGRVAWEGDPGFRSGEPWSPGAGDSYLDPPLRELAGRRHLERLRELGGSLETGRGLYDTGDYRGALEALNPLADLDAPFDDAVQAARDLRDRINARAGELPREAEAAADAGRPLRAAALLAKTVAGFPGSSSADLARRRLRELKKESGYKTAVRGWRELERAAADAERGRDPARIAGQLDKALERGGEVPEVREAAEALRRALADGGAAAAARAWVPLAAAAAGN